MSTDGWSEKTFSEITHNLDKKRKPLSSKTRSGRQGGFPYYGAQGIIDYIDDYIFDGTYLLIAEDGENLKSKQKNVAQLASGQFWVNNHAHIIENNEMSDIRFICYLFNHTDISGYVTGSAQPKLSQANLNKIKLPLPPLPEQKAIADTLSCLDDKIELNNKINKNLEAQAQAIFKSWFVDFEPFQDGEFVDSELGRIPKGWSVGTLLDIADYLNGLAMQKYRPDDDEKGIPVLKIKELRQGNPDSNSELCTPNIDKKYIINDGDVIFSWSGSLLVDIWCGGTCGLNQHLFKVSSLEYDKWFYYFWTTFHLEKFQSIAEDKATTMGHIKRDELKKSLVIIPSANNYKQMSLVMNPIIDKIVAIRVESRTLTTLRDTLLPKLMSGELRVPLEVE